MVIKRIILFAGMCISCLYLSAQVINKKDSSFLVLLNQRIDQLVVEQNVLSLDSLYANDFVFSHGSGKIEGKKSWLGSVGRTRYPLRQHDSVTVELHPGIAIVKGKMDIERIDKGETVKYILGYVRVYALREKRWQLISHSTVKEYHL